jgi:phosphoglycolate phosphatase-like HAD superfamily hydrolase
MARIEIGSKTFDADLVAFDKDGTLIEMDGMWGRLAEAWVAKLTDDEDQALERDLYHSLGYDPARQRTLSQSPLSIATTGQLKAIAAGTLYRHGIPWPEAEDQIQAAFRQVSDELALPDLVRPVGDVAGLFTRLQGAGIRLALATTDHRAETEETMRLLRIENLVDHLVCGDDGWPLKPAPDMLLAACDQLQIDPGRTVVVGDTLADMLMAQRAGSGLRVAVLTGPDDPALLVAHSDVVIQSIDDIAVAKNEPS